MTRSSRIPLLCCNTFSRRGAVEAVCAGCLSCTDAVPGGINIALDVVLPADAEKLTGQTETGKGPASMVRP